VVKEPEMTKRTSNVEAESQHDAVHIAPGQAPADSSERREPPEELADPEPQHDRDLAADEDVVSDPARDDGSSADWTTEGGATPAGPATASGRTPDERADE
jgi:hypothetical protein